MTGTDRVTVGRQSYVKGLTRAHREGKQAARDRKPITDCPFKRTDMRASWASGYAEQADEMDREFRRANRMHI